MPKDNIVKALNEQINAELYSAYLYYSMSACAASMNFNGFAAWLHVQAREELAHADKFYMHIIDRGGIVTLGPVQAPPSKWESIRTIFEDVSRHEQEVTARIHRLMDAAIQEKDHATQAFLQWFVNEQVEEERNSSALLERIRMIGASVGNLLYLDKEAGKRKAE
ncbi:MAG: ferritin [Acidobacteriota bacterium]